jgi:hypothetical protein
MERSNLITVAAFNAGLAPATIPTNDAGCFFDLPSPNTRRWTARRKAAVLTAIRHGTINSQEACERYCLSDEELEHWERDLGQYGVPGLRTTRVGIYRKTSKPK